MILKDTTLAQDLVFTKTNYSFVSESIKKLETADLTLVESMDIIEEFKVNVKKVKGPIARIIIEKFEETLKKNEGYRTLLQYVK